MPAEVEQFLSELHRDHLKPRGFRKVRHTFTREQDGYVEAFEVQGSAWNSTGEPWRFYLNVGVEFPDLSRRTRVRIRQVVPGAPEHFDLLPPPETAFVTGLVALIDSASAAIQAQLPAIHDAFEQERFWIGY